MRILCKLGDLQVVALVDTGSDYDAINAELSKLQEAKGNPSFVDRNKANATQVKGFQDGMTCTVEGESRWLVTLEGSKVLYGPRSTQTTEWKLAEFSGLGDPLIFGMPTVDEKGGLETLQRRSVWMAGLWIDRWRGRKLSTNALSISSITSSEAYRPTKVQGPRTVQEVKVSDTSWVPITTYWDSNHLSELAAIQQPCWLEASPDCPEHLEVLNSVVVPYGVEGITRMDVLVKAEQGHEVVLNSVQTFCQMCAMDDERRQAITDFNRAKMTREYEPDEEPPPGTWVNDWPESDIDLPELVDSGDEGEQRQVTRIIKAKRNPQPLFPKDKHNVSLRNGRAPTISTAKYKTAQRTDQQAKLFPDLEKEISERRKQLNAPTRDQKGAQYKAEICQKVKDLKLCPDEYYDLLCERILKPFSDRFWDEGCAAPSIKGFKAHIDLKPLLRYHFGNRIA